MKNDQLISYAFVSDRVTYLIYQWSRAIQNEAVVIDFRWKNSSVSVKEISGI